MTRTPDGLRTVTWDIPHDLAAVGKARHMAGDVLTGWGLDYLADDVVLVIGELLSNAVSHGAPPIRLSLWATADDLCVRVTDHGPEAPRHLDLGPDAVHGRGLPIVAALAGAFGVIPLPEGPGKTVWARWRTAPTTTETRASRAAREHDHFTLNPHAVISSEAERKSLRETLEILSDPEMRAELAEAAAAEERGDLTSEEEMAAIIAARLGKASA
ncbi:ATP-binding protein [Sphaerisporangium sp. NPDC051011]|uniref:ATP-binding protein n=1 Tax=Sphaerisporangium sp. NPDC051011 TaxID=3155792 RepID=UPI0033EC5A05